MFINYLRDIFCLAVGFLLIVSCNPASNGESSDSIRPGFYGLEAQSTSINEEVVSSGPLGAGGYFAERLQFFKGDSLQIKVKSDIVNENGLAKAVYQIQDSHLVVNILASTTSRYGDGEKIIFTDYRIVDESFSHAIKSSDSTYTFTGPGLVLESQYADKQDLDDDNNTSETVIRTEFYSYFTKYDGGGL